MNVDIANLDAVLFSYFWLDIKVVRGFLEQRTQKDNAVISDNVDINPLLSLYYAYNPNPKRAIFFSVADNATIMFPNLQDGWNTLFHVIANGLFAKACNMTIMDNSKFTDSSNYLIYSDDSQKRVVYTLKEDRWVFFEQGAPLPFEDTAYYNARQKRERLSKEIMLEYCESLEIAKNGIITLNADGAFSYELYWSGKLAGSRGAGSTSFVRK
ncbi:MAG: hypothetical protein LBC96_04850 [Lachnospiraceae bacterium]|nr:hypothetical protein [Lachnospiraceae bacterium]